jgi:hypothetical protein
MRAGSRGGHAIVVGWLTLFAAFAAAASAPGADGSSCQPPIPPSYRDSGVVVWTQDAPHIYVDFVACWRATGRTVTAIHFGNDCVSHSPGVCDDIHPTIRRVKRSGPWLAMYVDNDIHAGIALSDVEAGTTPRAGGYFAFDEPREMVLRRDGALAWISDDVTSDFESTRVLRLCAAGCRANGREAPRLATGRKLSRLRFARGRLYWSDGTRMHSSAPR